MTKENIMFYEYGDGLYNIADIYLYDNYFGYEDSYNYYDIDVNKILIYKKSDNGYVIRYDDVNKMKVVLLQLKIKSINDIPHDILHESEADNMLISTDCNDKKLFIKFRKIWNKILELTGINNAHDFVRNAKYGCKYITSNVHENASFVKGNIDELIIVLHSVVDKCLISSLVQVKNINPYKYNH